MQNAINPITSEHPTAQEIFNTAYIGVVRQGMPSISSLGGCAYRGNNGTACGIGHLIPDDVAEKWDNGSVASIFYIMEVAESQNVYGVKYWMRQNIRLLNEIQFAHDEASGVQRDFLTDFKERMADIAEQYNLTIPTMESAQ